MGLNEQVVFPEINADKVKNIQGMNIAIVTILISLSFFFLELTVGTMWAIPMDITRDFSGIAAGMMNFGAGLAGVLSPPLIGYIIDKTNNWDNALWCSIAVLVLGALLTVLMRPEKPFVWTHGESDVNALAKPVAEAGMG